MSRALAWFRRDLRLTDNPALEHALANHASVVPVYIHAPDEEAPWQPGSAQQVWLHFSLQALADSLRSAGSGLIIRAGNSLDALQALISACSAEAVYWNRLYEPNTITRDQAVKQTLRADGITAESFNAALLHEPWEVRTNNGQPYKVFTPYWRNIRERPVDPPLAAPADMPSLPGALASLDVADLALLPRIRWDGGIRHTWRPGEAGARAVLDAFCGEDLIDYDQARNQPDTPGTSCLSPYLHFGELGPRQIWHTISGYAHGRAESGLIKAADTYLREIGWREFAHHILYYFPQTPEHPMDARFEQFEWARDYQAELQAWQQGRTGIPMVDAGMRELWHTGWMHNRVRMVVASFLIKNLLIPWQEGERWFWDTLVDADLANNTMGWQWTAGCGVDAAPYFRVFNPVTQGSRFDPEGEYVARWLPELVGLDKKTIHQPWQASQGTLDSAGIELGKDYPEPLVDLKESRKRALARFEAIKK